MLTLRKAGLTAVVAAVLLTAGAQAAYACNQPSLAGVSGSARAGEEVDFSIKDMDRGADYEVSVGGDEVDVDVDEVGNGVMGTFTMPDLGGSSRTVHVEIEVNHENTTLHEDGNWTDSEEIEYRADDTADGGSPNPGPNPESAVALPNTEPSPGSGGGSGSGSSGESGTALGGLSTAPGGPGTAPGGLSTGPGGPGGPGTGPGGSGNGGPGDGPGGGSDPSSGSQTPGGSGASPVVAGASGQAVFGGSKPPVDVTRAQSTTRREGARGPAGAPWTPPGPSERSASGDLWSGFESGAAGSLVPSPTDGASADGQRVPLGVGMALLGFGLTALLAGFGLAEVRRRRSLAG